MQNTHIFLRYMFKKLAAICAATICCLGNPAGATPRDYNQWQQLESKLNSVGVIVVKQQACAPEVAILATYNPYTNILCISQAAAESDRLLSIVTHEVVHVVQDCIAGMANGKMGSVTRYLSNGDKAEERELDEALFRTLEAENNLDHVSKLTNQFQATGSFIEVEAYALQNNQPAVHQLLDQCQ